MSIRRKSTTHDLATLRLHPDGSRVQQTSNNVKSRVAKYSVEDSRGNWVARDASGQGIVKKRKTANISNEHLEEDEFELSDDDKRSRSRSKSTAKRKVVTQEEDEKMSDMESEIRDSRAKKRRSFVRDLNFLVPPLYPALSTPVDSSSDIQTIKFSEPSSELLKSIHHFASCYYRETGHLRDGSKDYRGRKKIRGLKQLGPETAYMSAADSIASDWTRESYESEGDEDEDTSEHECNGEDENNESSSSLSNVAPNKDMYKAFDGSALVAIGMLLQEHIAHTMLSENSRTPMSQSERK
ncbi:hypothetical protein BJ138DRAFT_1082582 [Hygrophoropsis aurantiaca]|uniref:Uncharacterized protein n=1 Tax=Hygrophoropsis aurantiaca TaxID=72124 RepID=A0ACB8AK51_9AGAM|nr:hypothetical protein BJ138DRAFT_1082582 [Hygrophoropsis aurantiaca]